MKNVLFVVVIMLLSMCNRGPGKTKTEDNSFKKDAVSDTSKSLTGEYMDSLQYYKTRRDNTKLKIIELKKFLAARQQNVKNKLDKRINEIERKLNELDNKMDNWEDSSEIKWKNTKDEVGRILKELENVIDSTRNELRKNK